LYIPLRLLTSIFLFGLLFSCQSNSYKHDKEFAAIKDSVQLLLSNTERDMADKGSVAWLGYFENSPNFYMASDGSMAFQNYQAADTFIKETLIKQIRAISLKLSDIRIDVISNDFATIGARFHEDLTDFTGKTMPFDGYFSATTHLTEHGWKYRNMHWSIKKQ
jgi:hypothetical protein